MKKLLMKWFPSYFNVTEVYDFDSIEVITHPYRLAQVDKDTSHTFVSLGIPDDRLVELFKKTKSAMYSEGCKIKTLIKLEADNEIKHINEFYAIAIFMEKEADMMGPKGLMKMLFEGLKGHHDRDEE